MATKAQLEAELAELRQQLAERPAENPEPQQAEPEATIPPEFSPEPAEGELDLDKEIGELISQLDGLPAKHPLLLALGAFAVGYLIGRTR